MDRTTRTAIIVATSVVVLALHAAYYFPFIPDDAFISLRYAARFLQGHGLTWTSGPPVEGYSNFLWVMLVAGLGSLGVDLILASRVLGGLASLLVIAALVVGSARYRLWSMPAAAVACVVWACSGPVGAWSLAGLEHPLVVALLAWTFVTGLWLQGRGSASFRELQVPGALLGVLVLVRLDAPLFAAVFAAWWWWSDGRNAASLRSAASLLLIPALALGAQEVFRIAYYDDWLPNVARAKLNASVSHLMSGLSYVAAGLAAWRPLAELTVVGLVWLVWRRATRAPAALLLAWVVLWLTYVAIMGRDLFPAWRHLLPAILSLTLALALGFDALRNVSPVLRHRRIAAALGGACFALFAWNQLRDVENQRAKTERWEWNGEVVGRALKKGFGPMQPTLGIMAAGAVPYWAEIDCLDMFGLSDRHIARVRTTEWGEGKLGHETRDAKYVLSRRPDLILFGTPGGYEPNVYVEGLADMPEFRSNYERCNISGSEPRYFNSRIWVNRNSPRLGIRRDERVIEVPSYLLNLTGGAIAKLDAEQHFYVETSPEEPVGIAGLDLQAGRWSVLEPKGMLRVLVNQASKGFREAELVDGTLSFVIDTAGRYDILLVSETERIPVRRLLLRRH